MPWKIQNQFEQRLFLVRVILLQVKWWKSSFLQVHHSSYEELNQSGWIKIKEQLRLHHHQRNELHSGKSLHTHRKRRYADEIAMFLHLRRPSLSSTLNWPGYSDQNACFYLEHRKTFTFVRRYTQNNKIEVLLNFDQVLFCRNTRERIDRHCRRSIWLPNFRLNLNQYGLNGHFFTNICGPCL